MKTLLVALAFVLAVATADVSHLANRYLTPNNHHMQNNQHGMMMQHHQKQSPSKERVETKIEKHEVIELPTQIEIIKDGQPIYGVHQQPIQFARIPNNNERMPEINIRYLPPSQEIQNVQPPQVPFEMPMRDYLSPIQEENTTTDMPTTTTMMPPTTTYNSMMSYNEGEETTTEKLPQEDRNKYSITTEMPTHKPQSYKITAATSTMPENPYLLSMPMPQNHYLPPTSMSMMLPPPKPMPQPTYQQYQEQMMHAQQMQQMFRNQEMQEMFNAIAEMEQQQMIALEPQMQPLAPVDPGHILSEDGYHYRTAADDVRRFRYRH